MTLNLKSIFDGICAEDDLKADTLQYLEIEMQKHNAARRKSVRKFAAVVASVAVMLLFGALPYTIYLTPCVYLDVDINPSVELVLNRYNRVISANSYNGDGEDILSALTLKHKKYDEALMILIDTIDKEGYIQNSSLVSVTLQTDDVAREDEMLTDIQSGVTEYMAGHHGEVRIDVFSVSGDMRITAYEQGVSPAKYLAIQELIEADPTATVEGCRVHSISEIRLLTQKHVANHHGGEPSGGEHHAGGRNGHYGGSHK